MSPKANDIRDRVVDFRRVCAEEIAVNPKNFRKHPVGQRDALRGMLKQIGVAGALLTYYSERNGGQLTLIDGELRKTDNPKLEWPVIVTDLKDEEADLLLATHDPLAAMAETDAARLDALLRDVSTGDAAVAQMLSSLAENNGLYFGEKKEEDESKVADLIDRAAELQEKWKVKRGDLFTIGSHRLLCGDSMAARDVLRLLGEESYGILATSPPYADLREYTIGKFDWLALMNGVWDACTPHAADDAHILINLGLAHRDRKVNRYWDAWLDHAEESGWPLFGWYVWDKGKALPGEWNGRLAPAHEFIFHFNNRGGSANKWVRTKTPKNNKKHTFRQPDGSLREATSPDKLGQAFKIPDSVIRIMPHMGKDSGHPAMFSVEFASFLIQTWSVAGEIALEPFCGGGTMLVACEQSGRICYGMEIEPKYCAVTLERMSLLGLEPKLEK